MPAVAVKDILKDNLLAPAPVAQLFTNQSEASLLPHHDLPVNLDLYNTSVPVAPVVAPVAPVAALTSPSSSASPGADDVTPEGEYDVHEEGLCKDILYLYLYTQSILK